MNTDIDINIIIIMYVSEVQWMYFLTLCRPFTAISCFKHKHMYVVTHRSPTLIPILYFVILFFFAESESCHRFNTNSFIIDGRGGNPQSRPDRNELLPFPVRTVVINLLLSLDYFDT